MKINELQNFIEGPDVLAIRDDPFPDSRSFNFPWRPADNGYQRRSKTCGRGYRTPVGNAERTLTYGVWRWAC
jgi:hypothetical protein